MKTLLFGLLLVAGISAFANPSVVKTLDGRIASCSSDANVGAFAFLPSTYSVATQGDQIQISIALQWLKCEKGASYAFQPVPMPRQIPSQDLSGNPILIQIVSQNAMLVDRDDNLLGEADAFANPGQSYVFPIAVSKLLSSSDAQKIKAGDVAHLGVEFFYSFVTHIQTADGIIQGHNASGSYFILFDLTKEASTGTYHVQSVNLP